MKNEVNDKIIERFKFYRTDYNGWVHFAIEVLGCNLDDEQKAILTSVQHNKMTTVASGTSRGKDFICAVACVCFMYNTPEWDEKGELIGNTKVAMTAPTGRQVENIMVPEISRLFKRAQSRGVELPGRLVGNDIRTPYEEWFLTGFKADANQHEAWTGFHAVNTMFAVTEATGISESIFTAIEGNLQGNSRIIIVFNPNRNTGYAAASHKSDRWHAFQLNSLNAPNVVEKRMVIPGQVDYEWVADKVKTWCELIPDSDFNEGEDDFRWEGKTYRPNDDFRKKVLGKFPRVSEDQLIPLNWIQLANERWKKYHEGKGTNLLYSSDLKIGIDVAGMGRDDTVLCPRFDHVVKEFQNFNSAGVADHMKTAGLAVNYFTKFPKSTAFIDTIGEGAGVYSRLSELEYGGKESIRKYGFIRAYSSKNSNAARDDKGKDLKDITGEYTFANMRAYLYWAVRDWLNPVNNTGACLPPDNSFAEEATQIMYSFQSNGKIIMEPKEDIKERLGRSTDKWDSLTLTFWPEESKKMLPKNISKASLGFY